MKTKTVSRSDAEIAKKTTANLRQCVLSDLCACEKPFCAVAGNRLPYFTETVTPCWLWLPPKLTTIG